jgi:hypothetical protein
MEFNTPILETIGKTQVRPTLLKRTEKRFFFAVTSATVQTDPAYIACYSYQQTRLMCNSK